jgi:molybdate transport system regulatory protein
MQTVRFRIDFTPTCSLGPGKIALLETIGRTGSLCRAARELGMSYRYAWRLLDDINHMFAQPATTASVGGAGGGGVELTPFGTDLIRRYRALARRIDRLAQTAFRGIAVRTDAQSSAPVARKRLARSPARAK